MVDEPWFSIWKSAPCAPFSSNAKIPSTMNPSFAMEEYAERRRRFVLRDARIDPYEIKKTAR